MHNGLCHDCVHSRQRLDTTSLQCKSATTASTMENRMSVKYLDGRVAVSHGDITQWAVDAIVNAANASLLGGGGVDGAIHSRGGPTILAACREIRQSAYRDGLPIGHAVITTAGDLPAANVIHTVGPVWGRDEPAADLLATCYRNCIALADARQFKEIAFPAISTGAYGYPKVEAAVVASEAIKASLSSARSIATVHLVFFAAADARVFVENQRF